jgi:dihydrofolate synthase / folylpolyglutamate synthase
MERTLEQWLDYQLTTHPQTIAMGLERVREVAARMGLLTLPCPVITVAGTNGKGSTVAFIAAIAKAAGHRVGAFTSPHILRYNERIRIDGVDASDADLCEAFSAIEAARKDIPLTYFEFGTLAALFLFSKAALDLVVLEVGLGGRLDAVNCLDADVAVITTVDLDHQALLGNDREAIGFEKAGIMRAGRPCIVGEKDPPSSVLQHAYINGVYCVRAFSDYLIDRYERHWVWREPGFELTLPYPQLLAPAQLQNAACAIAALRATDLEIAEHAWAEGVQSAQISGRLQHWQTNPDVILDVAHNRQSVAQLAEWLAAKRKPTLAVFSALNDKDIVAMIDDLRPHIGHWYVAPLREPAERVTSYSALADIFGKNLPAQEFTLFTDIPAAYRQACLDCTADGRVLVFGSFHTLESVMRATHA